MNFPKPNKKQILQQPHSFGYDCQKRFNLCVADPDWLIFASGNLIHFYNVGRDELTFKRCSTGGGIGHITKNPQRPHIAVGENGIDPPIIVYEWPSMEIVTVLRNGTTRSYSHLRYSPQGDKLVSQGGEPDYLITVWNWEQSTVALQCKSHSQDVYNVVFSETIPGQLVSCGLGHIKCWKMADTFTGLKLQGELGRFSKTEISDIIGVYPMPDEKIVSGCEWGNMLVWNEGLIKIEVCRKSGKPCHADGYIAQFEYLSGELVTVGTDGWIYFWFYDTIDQSEPSEDNNLVEVEPIYEFSVGQQSDSNPLARRARLMQIIRRDPSATEGESSHHWYAQDGNGGIWLLDLSTAHWETAVPRRLMSCHAGPVEDVAACDWAPMCASCGRDGRLRVYDYQRKRLVLEHQFRDRARGLVCIDSQVEPSGSSIVCGFDTGVLRLVALDLEPPQDSEHERVRLCQIYRAHTEPIVRLAIDPRHKILVSFSQDSSLFVFQILSSADRSYPRLVPIGYLSLPSPASSFAWKPNETGAILVGCSRGQCLEVRLPTEPQAYTKISYRLSELRPREFAFRSVKSAILREQARLELEANRYERRLQKIQELQDFKKNNPGMEVDEEAFLESGMEDEDGLPDLYVPEVPSEVLTCMYDSRGQPQLSMSGYDAGYVYEYSIPAEGSANDEVEHLRSYLILGTQRGALRVCRLKPEDEADWSDYWTLPMHDHYTGRVQALCLGYDRRTLVSCGLDGNVFTYAINDDAPLEDEFNIPKPIASRDHIVPTSRASVCYLPRNDKLPASQRLTEQELQLDPRISADLDEQLKEQMDIVYRKSEYKQEKCRLRLKKLMEHFIEPITCIPFAWKKLQSERPDPKAVDPEDEEAIEHAKRTIGDYKLKASLDLDLDKRPTVKSKYKQIIECRRKIHFRREDFNSKVREMRQRKVDLIKEVEQLLKSLRAIQSELPDELTKPLPHLPSLDMDVEFPEKKLEIAEYTPLAQRLNESKNRRQSITQAHMPSDEFDEEYARFLATIEGAGAPGFRKRFPEDTKPVKLLVPLEVIASIDAAERLDTDLERELKRYRAVRKKHEQDQMLEHIDHSYRVFDEELSELELERLKIIHESVYMDLYMLTLHQELVVLKKFEAKEVKLEQLVEEHRRVIDEIEAKISLLTDQTEEKKLTVARLQEKLKEMMARYLSSIQEQRYSIVLAEIARKSYESSSDASADDAASRSPAADDKDKEDRRRSTKYQGDLGHRVTRFQDMDSREEQQPQQTDRRASKAALPRVSSLALVDPQQQQGDEDEAAGGGDDLELYEEAYAVQKQCRLLEGCLSEEQKALSEASEELERQRGSLQEAQRDLDASTQRLEGFLHEKQRELNDIDMTVILKLDQVQLLAEGSHTEKLRNCIVFDKTRLARLYARVGELQQETDELRAKHKSVVHRVSLALCARTDKRFDYLQFQKQQAATAQNQDGLLVDESRARGAQGPNQDGDGEQIRPADIPRVALRGCLAEAHIRHQGRHGIARQEEIKKIEADYKADLKKLEKRLKKQEEEKVAIISDIENLQSKTKNLLPLNELLSKSCCQKSTEQRRPTSVTLIDGKEKDDAKKSGRKVRMTEAADDEVASMASETQASSDEGDDDDDVDKEADLAVFDENEYYKKVIAVRHLFSQITAGQEFNTKSTIDAMLQDLTDCMIRRGYSHDQIQRSLQDIVSSAEGHEQYDDDDDKTTTDDRRVDDDDDLAKGAMSLGDYIYSYSSSFRESVCSRDVDPQADAILRDLFSDLGIDEDEHEPMVQGVVSRLRTSGGDLAAAEDFVFKKAPSAADLADPALKSSRSQRIKRSLNDVRQHVDFEDTESRSWTIFRAEEIECLLQDSINLMRKDKKYKPVGEAFVKCVARNGYRDEPKVGMNGKSSSRRATPIHIAARFGYYDIIPDLFKIYNRCDVNYSDDEGCTHFHVAIQSGLYDVVEKFLELGQDPNCMAEKSEVNFEWPPLHLALLCDRRDAMELLLRRGADPNAANEKGLTPLHIINKREKYADVLARQFFEIVDELNQRLRIDARDKLGNTPLYLALLWDNKKLAESLLRRGRSESGQQESMDAFARDLRQVRRLGRDVVRDERRKTSAVANQCSGRFGQYTAALGSKEQPRKPGEKGSTPLHIICQKKYNDLATMILEDDDDKRTVRVDVRDNEGNTPLHLALVNGCKKQIIRLLLKGGANPNSANLKGVTALHIVCEKGDGRYWLKMLFELSQAKYRPLQLDVRDESGNTPLHLALKNGEGTEMAETLLRRGADPNLANQDGEISLHVQCALFNDPHMLRMIFELSHEKYHPVQVNAQDNEGNTPLHLIVDSVSSEAMEEAEIVLRRGADPNLANEDGDTPLHRICEIEDESYELAELFFEISDEENYRPVRVNVPNKLGDTPLHRAAQSGGCDRRAVVRLLLGRDADPKSANNDGLTPLHVACAAEEDDSSVVKMLLEIGDEIDVEDDRGRTPLQLAVANVLPETVDVLLDNGADLSNFVFPTDLAENSLPEELENWNSLKLRLAPRALLVVEHLEKRGYKLDLSQALIVMSMFAKYDMFARKLDLAVCRYDDDFRRAAKLIETSPSMSLDDLIQLRPKEAAKQLKFMDYLELDKSIDWKIFSELGQEACAKHLCEKLSRRFFLDWALECFVVLIHNRLPMPCCEIIIDELTNEDLWNICLAAAGKTDDDSHIVSVIPRSRDVDVRRAWHGQRLIDSMDPSIRPALNKELFDRLF
ncbi:unnamed protein product [Trichogramma brassicae]|uniref:Uncharacterized protein n=1 Tax=Trichogramma brassicae TaxID=86971 RepID=A0A6H5HYP4_9HYME|nr:unnamed protein product [Trichogramma brassicae]